MPGVAVLPFRSSDSDHLAKILISLDDMSSPFGSKEGGKEGGDEKSPPHQRGSNSSTLQDALSTQDFFASAFKSILESSDKKTKDHPAGSPFQSHSSMNEEDLIKILASSDSDSAFRTAGSLLKHLSQKDNSESLRKKPNLLRSTSETLLSKESLANALASGDWALLRQLSASKSDIPDKPPSGLKRKASDAFPSKDSISELFASADLALLRQLSSASKSVENPESLPHRKRSGSNVFGSKDSIANALASGDWAMLRQLSTSSKAGEGSSETNKTGSSKGAALSASSIASKDAALQSLANAFSSEDWSKEYKRQHVDIEYAPKDVFEGEKSAKGRRQSPYAPPPPKFALKESTKSSWLNGYYKDVAEAKPKVAPATTKQKPVIPLSTKAKPIVVSNPNTKAKKKASNPSSKKPKSNRHSRREPSLKVYVEPADGDVLFGRGGRSNNHPGNKGYRDELEKLKPLYKTSDKSEKTELAQLLVDTIKEKQGGRFLQRDDDGKYYQVDNVVARRKASQALREENTPESRQAKRAKYGKN